MTQFGRKATDSALTETVPVGGVSVDDSLPPVARSKSPELSSSSGTMDAVRDQVFTRIEPAIAVRLTKRQLTARVLELVAEIATQQRLLLNEAEQQALAADIVDEMIGLGALESLLRDPSVNDILVNGPKMTYVERRGKLELTQVKFRNDAHIMHVAQRIASQIGRRVDEFKPHARRPPSGWKSRQRHNSADQPEGPLPFHSQVFEIHDEYAEIRRGWHRFAAAQSCP